MVRKCIMTERRERAELFCLGPPGRKESRKDPQHEPPMTNFLHTVLLPTCQPLKSAAPGCKYCLIAHSGLEKEQ